MVGSFGEKISNKKEGVSIGHPSFGMFNQLIPIEERAKAHSRHLCRTQSEKSFEFMKNFLKKMLKNTCN